MSRRSTSQTSVAIAIGFALGVIVTGLLLVPLPAMGRGARAFQDLLHAPIFAFLGAAIFAGLNRSLDNRKLAAALIAAVLAAGIGVSSELMQKLTGRTASWHDGLADVLGAGAGVLWAYGRTVQGIRSIPNIVAALLIVLASVRPLSVISDALLQHRDMPQLGSFEHPWEPSRWDQIDCRLGRDQQHATAGGWALRVELQPGRYPGIDLTCPPADWSEYHALVFDVAADEGEPLDLIVKIKDKEHNNQHDDRFHRRIVLSSRMNRFVVSLDQVKAAPKTRDMDLSRISSLQFFTVNLQQERTFFVDNIHLR